MTLSVSPQVKPLTKQENWSFSFALQELHRDMAALEKKLADTCVAIQAIEQRLSAELRIPVEKLRRISAQGLGAEHDSQVAESDAP